MADDTILAVAEAERDQARALLDAHVRECPVLAGCCKYRSLAEHAVRTQRQVELLTGADPDMEALW